VPVTLTVDTNVDDLELKEKEARFLDQTGLYRTRPFGPYEARLLESYDGLLEHIQTHRWYLGEKLGRQPTLDEAATSWYDLVYMPVVRAMQEQGLLKAMPNAAEPDLYLWIAKYQWYLRMAYQQESTMQANLDEPPNPIEESVAAMAKDQAVRHLREDEENLPAVRRLANVLRKTSWIDELALEQDRAAFLARTQLLASRPEADIRVTTPGQYGRLLEHIDVHRWYLGVERQSPVSHADAATSWYDNVYLPLIELVREQDLLCHFPNRTETDLYLWLVNRRETLKQVYA
jgi:hypothetical protein